MAPRHTASGSPPRLRPDLRYVVLGLLVTACAAVAPRPYMSALIGIGLAVGIIGCLPARTRPTMAVAMLGMAASTNAFLAFATGVFQDPLVREFGWSRSQYVVTLQIVAVSSVLTLPLVGRLIDRYGIRRIAVPSYLLFAALLATMSQMTGRLSEFYAAYLLIPVLGGNWFDRRRGLAFGAILSGVGIGGATLAPLTQEAISAFGWRGGYLTLAALELLVVTPLLWWFVRDRPSDIGLGKDGETPAASTDAFQAPTVLGLTAPQTRRRPLFWYLMLTFIVLAFAMGGVMLQLFPILTARGMPAKEAAAVLGALGLALIAGRTCAGWLMDFLPARVVACAFLGGPIAGCLLLANGATGSAATVAAVLVGLAAGAEIDVLAYLVSRYFGGRAFGANYGWLYAAWGAGSGLGPQLGAVLFDRSGGYSTALFVDAGLFTLAIVLLSRLGPYPDWNADVAEARAAGV